MGIQGLLPALKSTTTPVHVREYAGKNVAVDTYCWLHKAAFACSKELCLGQPTSKYIDYCMHRINLLRHHGVRPLLVFDGGLLPIKMEQETRRARLRKENLDRASEHEKSGNHVAAYDCYQRAVDITPLVAFQLIKVLRQEKIQYIVAPYEADAQMAFLSLNGHIDAVITEDSDLIPFGCPKVIFKMDKFGQGLEFQYGDIAKNRDLNFTSFTKQMVLEMCILSGCDYLHSLQGMGLKRAHGLIRRFKSYQKVIKHLRYSGVSIPPDYEELFTKAVLTFRHQRVYDPVLEDIVHLTQVPVGVTLDLEFLGPGMPKKLVQAIANGTIDPITRHNLEDQYIYNCVPSKGGTERKQRRQLDLPVKNLLTNYYEVSVSEEAKQQFKAPRTAIKNLDKIFGVTHRRKEDSFQVKGMCDCLNASNISVLEEAELPVRVPRNGCICEERLDSFSICGEDGKLNDVDIHVSVPDEVDFRSAEARIILEDRLKKFSPNSQDNDLNDGKLVKGFDGCEVMTNSDNISLDSNSDFTPSTVTECQLSPFNKMDMEGCELNRKELFCLSEVTVHDMESLNQKMPNSFVSSIDGSNKISSLMGKSNKAAKKEKFVVQSVYFSNQKSKETNSVDLEKGQFKDNDYVNDRYLAGDFGQGQLGSVSKSLLECLSDTSNETAGQQSDMVYGIAHQCTVEGGHLKSIFKGGNKSIDCIAAGKRKHVPCFRSDLLGRGAEETNFASNTSHIQKYAKIAHESVDKFVSAIAPFRRTLTGARASGLRRPFKSALNANLGRNEAGGDLDRFAYSAEKCRQSPLTQVKQTLVVAGAVRWNDSCTDDWE
eukprot:c13755_g1_i1 orf=493-2964(+)